MADVPPVTRTDVDTKRDGAPGADLTEACVAAWGKECRVGADSPQAATDRQAKQIGEAPLNTRPLGEPDVAGMSPEMMGLLRNQMYAQYGRNFDNQTFGNFFKLMGSQPYPDKGQNGNIDAQMTDVQRNNAKFLLSHEGKPLPDLGAAAGVPEMPRRVGDSPLNTRLLTEGDVNGMTPTMLSVLRNSMFAQYGYHFVQNKEMGEYFKLLGEHDLADKGQTGTIQFSPIQQYNVQFLRDHEVAARAGQPQ